MVLACYEGADNVGIHLLGPLAKKVIRIAPPLTITVEEAGEAMELMDRLVGGLYSIEPTQTSQPAYA